MRKLTACGMLICTVATASTSVVLAPESLICKGANYQNAACYICDQPNGAGNCQYISFYMHISWSFNPLAVPMLNTPYNYQGNVNLERIGQFNTAQTVMKSAAGNTIGLTHYRVDYAKTLASNANYVASSTGNAGCHGTASQCQIRVSE